MISLLGRQRELSAIEEWMASGDRLLTISGPPGVGKSRLLRELAAAHPGTLVCELTSARTAVEVERTLQASLGVSRPRLARALASFEGVIVLDRFEHLVESARALVASWIAVPGPRFAITSREPLGLGNERLLALGPLEEPDALELYAARARREVDPVAALAIVRRLDRLPLAIELAASRASVLSESELLVRLERGIGAIDTAVPSLRATIRWSIDLLDAGERETLLQCSGFLGPFDGHAAESVVRHAGVADTVAHLVALERKSLVRRAAHEAGDARIALYDAVREVAQEQLSREGRLDEVAARHAAFHLVLARTGLDDPLAVGALVRAEPDLAAARRFLRDRDPAASAQLALAIDLAQGGQPPSESHLELLSAAVACAERAGIPELSVRTRHARARANRLIGSTRRSTADLRAALLLARSAEASRLEADVLRLLGVVARQLSRPRRARVLLERALALYESSGNVRGAAVVRDDLGVVAHDLGDLAEARDSYERALALERVCGDRRFEGITLGHLGVIAHDLGDLDGARTLLEEALVHHRACGDRRFEGFALAFMAAVALERSDLDEVRRLLDASHAIDARIGDVDSGVLLAGLECAATAMSGRIVDARAIVEQARVELSRRDDSALRRMLDVFALAIRIAEGKRANVEGRSAEESAHFEAVRRELQPSSAPRHVEERLARRVVGQLLDLARSSRAPLAVALDGTWFESGSARISLGRRRSLALMLGRLASERRRAPGRSVGIDALFDAGWPGERLAAASARRRVYVGIDTLRSLGLREAIVQQDRGYVLDPAVEVREPPF
jgi:tetratricopeptide (TPR) repeat protein